jgi:hypothetical protein
VENIPIDLRKKLKIFLKGELLGLIWKMRMKKFKKGHEVTHLYMGGEKPFRFGPTFFLVVWFGDSFPSWSFIGI